MNILIPHHWLLDHLETQATPVEIQKYLSVCGPSVERIETVEGEAVYDIEVTTNRIDSMSVRGIAREAVVILNQFGIKAKLKPLTIKINQQAVSTPNGQGSSSQLVAKINQQLNQSILPTQSLKLPKIKNNQNLCRRIICIILKDIQRSPTPAWMAKRLRQINVQVHESVIDITNYITHDLGHPCHAFDYDKVMQTGGKIIVKEAEKNKKFVTLDNEKYQTVGGEIVFENDQGEIIDLPAIKGTANTSINQSTKNILLWIENIDPQKIRFASMTHSIRTVAAQLNEKNIDPHIAFETLLKGIQLNQDLCHAKIASPIYDEFPGESSLKTISMTKEKIDQYLGLNLKNDQIIDILQQLGCRIDKQNNNTQFKVTIPSFRQDLTVPVDLIEEIARIYGYHNFPSQLMATAIQLKKAPGLNIQLEDKVKSFLAHIGWQEVYTYSMVSEVIAKQSGYSIDSHLKLLNPLTEDRLYLRRSLIPSLTEVLSANPQREKLSVFELANVYLPQNNNLPIEELHLTLLSNHNYRVIKGELTSLFNLIHLNKVSYINQEKSVIKANQSADIIAATHQQNNKLGSIYTINDQLIAIDIIWSEFLSMAKNYPIYQPIPKTGSIIEDLTFQLTNHTAIGELIENVCKISTLIHKIDLKDIYQNHYTFTLEYWNPKINISNVDVDPIRKQIVQLIESKYHAKLIGKL